MVAYSFKKQFGPPILAGTKAQTIRADRKRHARPGEELQLYTGMRTKHCRLLGRATCIDVAPVRLLFATRATVDLFEIDRVLLSPASMERFAQADGFKSVAEMAAFWRAEHPDMAGVAVFSGILIRWTPFAPADALDIGAAA